MSKRSRKKASSKRTKAAKYVAEVDAPVEPVQKKRRQVTDDVQSEVQRLAEEDRLTPEETVATASDPDNPMHSWFDWNDTIAGHKWRLEQARDLIQRCRVVVERTDHGVIERPRYLHDVRLPPGNAGYVSADDVKRSKVRRRASLAYELRAVMGHVRRVAKIAGGLGEVDVESECERWIEEIDYVVANLG